MTMAEKDQNQKYFRMRNAPCAAERNGWIQFLRLLNSQKSSSMISQNKKIESNDRSVQRIKGDRIQLSRCQLQRM